MWKQIHKDEKNRRWFVPICNLYYDRSAQPKIYLEPCQTSMTELFSKLVNGIINIWQGSKYISTNSKDTFSANNKKH